VAEALEDDQPAASHVELIDAGPAEVPAAADVAAALHQAPLEVVPETMGAEAAPEAVGTAPAPFAEPHPAHFAPAAEPPAAERVETVPAPEPTPASGNAGHPVEPEPEKRERQENLAAPQPILVTAPPPNPKKGWWKRLTS
jgi:hypothetical protein